MQAYTLKHFCILDFRPTYLLGPSRSTFLPLKNVAISQGSRSGRQRAAELAALTAACRACVLVSIPQKIICTLLVINISPAKSIFVRWFSLVFNEDFSVRGWFSQDIHGSCHRYPSIRIPGIPVYLINIPQNTASSLNIHSLMFWFRVYSHWNCASILALENQWLRWDFLLANC